MEDDKRGRLQQRRRMLQLRLAREAWSRQFRGIAPALQARGLRFGKVVPAALAPWLAMTARLPGRDERIDWWQVPGAVRHVWDDAAHCAQQLEAALAACGGLEGPVLLVFNPFQAALRIRARDLVAAWPAIHEALYEATWIVPVDRRPWLVEIDPGDRDLGYVAEAD